MTLIPVFHSDAHKNTLEHNESLISIKHCQIETTPTPEYYSLALNEIIKVVQVGFDLKYM